MKASGQGGYEEGGTNKKKEKWEGMGRKEEDARNQLTKGKKVPFSFCIHSASFRTGHTLCKQIYCQGRTAEHTWSGLGAQHP